MHNKEQTESRPKARLARDNLGMQHSDAYEIQSDQTIPTDNKIIQYEEAVINNLISPYYNIHPPSNEALDRDRNINFNENEETRNYERLAQGRMTSGSSANQSPYQVLAKPGLNGQFINQSDYENLTEGQKHQGLNDYEEFRRGSTDAASIFARRKIVSLIPPVYCETKN